MFLKMKCCKCVPVPMKMITDSDARVTQANSKIGACCLESCQLETLAREEIGGL